MEKLGGANSRTEPWRVLYCFLELFSEVWDGRTCPLFEIYLFRSVGRFCPGIRRLLPAVSWEYAI
jgi:hypothetical protein